MTVVNGRYAAGRPARRHGNPVRGRFAVGCADRFWVKKGKSAARALLKHRKGFQVLARARTRNITARFARRSV